jgi:hypothetical protein
MYFGTRELFSGTVVSVVSETLAWVVAIGVAGVCVTLSSGWGLAASVIGCAVGFGVIIWLQNSRDKTLAVYECVSCKKRFIGEGLKPFSYSTWKPEPSNPVLESDAKLPPL